MAGLLTKILAFGYLVWSGFLAVGAGFFGAALNCDSNDPCRQGFPSWLEPWRWGNYDTFPETLYPASFGLATAIAFVVLVFVGSRRVAMIALVASLAFLSYPFFAGLTSSGRTLFAFGSLLGIAAVTLSTARIRSQLDDRGITR